MSKHLQVVALTLLWLGGCAKTIDTKNEKTLKSSIQEIEDSLERSEQKPFQQAIQVVVMASIIERHKDEKTDPFAFYLLFAEPDTAWTTLTLPLHKKDAEEIITAGEKALREYPQLNNMGLEYTSWQSWLPKQ